MMSGSVTWLRRLLIVAFALSTLRTAESVVWGRLSTVASWLKPAELHTPDLVEGYVRYDENDGTFSFVNGLAGGAEDAVPAHGSFSDSLRHKSNFGQLRITTNPSFPDDVQMQAAGFLEGYLTAERIFDYAYNMKYWLSTQTNDTFKVGDWLFDQDRWARHQVRERTAGNSETVYSDDEPPSPSYWQAVGLLIAQSDGLLAGYSARLSELTPEVGSLERLTKWDFLVLNALGDMDDLLAIIFPNTDDGSSTADYDDLVDNLAMEEVEATSTTNPAASSGGTHTRKRRPNPERDASFFFRPESENEKGEAVANSGDGTGATVAARAHTAAAASAATAASVAPLRLRGSWEELTPAQIRARIAMRGRCTALIKVTPGLDDLLLGHVTWWSYASMVRIYKHYDLQLKSLRSHRGKEVANRRVSFSSYPGQISSADDWYLLGSGLVVTETSLDTFDHNRYNASYGCTTSSLLSWQRVLAANLLAEDGPGWAELAAAYNGGTYNNQYLVVNLNLFTPGEELKLGLLTISEIIPGLSLIADATDDLLLGHFPSYNVPYFPEVYDAAGYRRHAEALAARGAEFSQVAQGISYQLAPRAKIFRRDAAGARDIDSFRKLLRSNGWSRHPASADPLSASSPWDALCARGDLDPESPAMYGCYDGKVTNYKRALELSADAINGPTTESGHQAFRWDEHNRDRRTMKYRGMLDVYDTEWEEQRP